MCALATAALVLGPPAGVGAQVAPAGRDPEPGAVIEFHSVLPDDPQLLGTAGQVLSIDTEAPVAGAQVFYQGTVFGGHTDGEGVFWLETPEEGWHELHVRLIGFDEACVRLRLFRGVVPTLLIRLPTTELGVRTRSPACVVAKFDPAASSHMP